VVILAAVGLWFWWPHLHPKTVALHPPKAAPVAQPLAVKLPPATPPVTRTNAAVPRPSEPDFAANPPSAGYPRPVNNLFEAQVALARMAISSGSIDGALGSQTRLALRQFQRKNNLPQTGAYDHPTRALLTLDAPPLMIYPVTTNDLDRLQPLGKTWLEKSRQSALDFETELELLGEFSHAHPTLIRQLNPQVDWAHVTVGTALQVPDVRYPDPSGKAALVIIHLNGKYLEAFDAGTNLLLHCPCSIAAHVEKRPVGLLHVIVVAPNPNYTFDPAVFPESPEAQQLGRKLILPAGPNNPVGVAWMGLDRPGYGIHGTPAPEQVGRTESHGCFRLANWDAAYLVKLVWIGLPVDVVP
jgi:lipoprotein-anchoring transpeptidase ErfK/SrfK